ncbi:ATP-binding cassette domain-containing protein [Streptomyces sp. NPDC059567]|uniref:ATP-binding cassette domain-containing protein n=1 Tax=Streptomyces sp. NPDC059567 TaxID=3346867 RepID=UPI0036C534FE
MPIQYAECTFSYGKRRNILESLELTFPEGHTVLLGPNGAGKSTLLGLGASAMRPRRGRVLYDGLDTALRRTAAEYRRRIGWMPQRIDCLSGLTAREQVAYAGWLKGMARSDAWARSLEALRSVELGDSIDRPVKHLSGGQLRRVGVAQSLVHGAEVLLLDEPTAGMDPRQRRVFHDVLAGLRGRVQVVVSTHDVVDLDSSYDSVVVLLGGQVEFQGPVDEFSRLAPSDTSPGRLFEGAYAAVTEADAR